MTSCRRHTQNAICVCATQHAWRCHANLGKRVEFRQQDVECVQIHLGGALGCTEQSEVAITELRDGLRNSTRLEDCPYKNRGGGDRTSAFSC